MIVAGIGCRKDCPAAEIVALLRDAGPVDVLATPAWKRGEPGLLQAATLLCLPLRFVDDAALVAVQPLCPTRSETVARATGLASVAEAAALAGGGTLLRARFGSRNATCALASHPHPGPLPPAGEGEERGPEQGHEPFPLGRGLGEGTTAPTPDARTSMFPTSPPP